MTVPVYTNEEIRAMHPDLHVKHFDSIGEFLTEIEKPEYAASGRKAAYFSNNIPRAIDKARKGIPRHNDAINALVDKVQCELPAMQDAWVPSVSGPVPIVPAAIAGLPDNMLRLEQQETTGVPLRIFVSVCLSGGCGPDVIAQRGIAINALLQSVSARRPVELCIFGDMGDAGSHGMCTPVIRIQAMPLDVATLTGALTDPDFLRTLLFAYAYKHSPWTGQWAWGTSPTDPDAQAKTRAALGCAPDDLVILGAYLSESDLIIRDPMAWVQEQIALTEKQAAGGAG